jgi:hypothetical protein
MALGPSPVVLSGAPRNPRPIYLVLHILCITTILLSALGAASNLFEVLAPSAFETALASPILFNAYFFLGYANWIAFVLWLTYRLTRNLHALAPTKFSMSPTYAMAWYIVPIANLFMPARVVGVIARETYAAAGATQSNSTLSGWWWATWVTAALSSNAAAVLVSQSGAFVPSETFDGGAYEAALWLNVVAGGLTIAASLATIRLFDPIASLQSGLIKS